MSTTLRVRIGGLVMIAGLLGACTNNVIGPTRPRATTIRYTCSARAHMVATFLATRPALPTITQLPSGELVYIDWMERVYHHSGPECEG